MKKITIREIIKATGAQMIALGDMEEALNKEIMVCDSGFQRNKGRRLFCCKSGRGA